MESPDIFLERVLSNTYSTADAYKRLLLLEDFLQHTLYENREEGVDFKSALLATYQGRSEHSIAEAVAAWGAPVIESFSKENVQAGMQTMKRCIEELPKLILYTSVILEQKHVEAICVWCRKNIDPHVLLDMRLDTEAAGGCVLVWRNKLHDFSLRYFIKKHEDELSKLLATLPEAPPAAPTKATTKE